MIASLYPVLICDDVTATADFFRECFELETTFESDWYVSLRSASTSSPCWPRSRDPSCDSSCRRPGPVLVNIETDDVDSCTAGTSKGRRVCAQPLRSEEFGQRHFILVAPGGVLVDVIQPIAFPGPSPSRGGPGLSTGQAAAAITGSSTASTGCAAAGFLRDRKSFGSDSRITLCQADATWRGSEPVA